MCGGQRDLPAGEKESCPQEEKESSRGLKNSTDFSPILNSGKNGSRRGLRAGNRVLGSQQVLVARYILILAFIELTQIK